MSVAKDAATIEQFRAFRRMNLDAWRSKPDPEQFKNLDSNLKKNTAFIKKCRASLGQDALAQLKRDIKQLKLEKYVSEIVTAIPEGLQRCKREADVTAAVEIVSLLHQRFADTFSVPLVQQLQRAMAPTPKAHLASLSAEQREREETARVSKQRILGRIFVDLWLVGIFAGIDGGKEKERNIRIDDHVVFQCFYNLLKDDADHINLLLATSFTRYYGLQILNIAARKVRKTADGQDATTNIESSKEESLKLYPDDIISNELRQKYLNLFTEYYHSVAKHLVRDYRYMKRLERRNNEWAIARGEITEETRQNFDRVVKNYEKLQSSTQSLADYLDKDLPELPVEEDTSVGVSLVKAGGRDEDETDMGNGVWEDEDSRLFYESTLDLKNAVPAILLEGRKNKKESTANTVNDEPAELSQDTQATIDEASQPSSKLTSTATADAHEVEEAMRQMMERMGVAEEGDEDEDNDDADDAANPDSLFNQHLDEATATTANDEEKTVDEGGMAASGKIGTSAKLDSLLARLPTMNNRELIDRAAIDFCFLNTKGSRKRLAQALYNVPRTRLDLLPYYARLVATLHPYMPEISELVLGGLESEFRYLSHRKRRQLLESRIRNIRFIAELVKFDVTPLHVAFHCFKVLLDDFSSESIEILCHLLDSCGRFLFRTPATHARTNTMLEIVMKKKQALPLDARLTMMIENAYYQCNPPEAVAREEKERTPIEQYARKLIYIDLGPRIVEKVLRSLRKFDWDDPEIVTMMVRLLTKPWKIQYSQLHLLAVLASGLYRYHSDLGVMVIDTLLEEIRVGLEKNLFRQNQRRVSVVRYLGELYNYRMIDSSIVFETLYTIITLGHENGRPAWGRICWLDLPNDFFRVRLCCVLLDTCGIYFNKGPSKARLDAFLTFFQMYCLTKSQMPMDADYMVKDLYDLLRPHMKLHATYEAAQLAVDELLMANLKAVQEATGDTSQVTGPMADPIQLPDNEEEYLEDEEEDDDDEDEEESERSDEDEDEEDDEDEEEEEDEDEDEEELPPADNDEHGTFVDPDDDNVVVVLGRKDETSIDEEFEKEFSLMMAESLESRKFERKAGTLDVAIPMHLRGSNHEPLTVDTVTPSDGQHVSFTLLLKRGNRQQTKIVDVPSDSALAVSTRQKQSAEKEEKQRLKQLVLNYEEREQAQEMQSLKRSLAQQGVHLKHSGHGRSQRGRSNPSLYEQ
ncbi:armadillo-type protein [Syncephalis fuscata]|nr:armadillo-type protein [Syncephalis fuscata]